MIITENIFPLEWSLKDPLKVEYHGKKVFGTFVCGGGSTMGYKLAGYEHLGGVEFTEHYSRIYKKNHNPKFFFMEDMRDFVNRTDLPDELYHLDLLDGSPPCAAFSTAGKREDIWGKQSTYENKVQQKDDLPFVYCSLISKLLPKVFLLENVSGLSKGNGKVYIKKIIQSVAKNYDCQVFLLYAASMGIPQLRQRTFIIGKRKDFNLPKLSLDFRCPQTTFAVTKKFWNDAELNKNCWLTKPRMIKEYEETPIGHNHPKHFSRVKLSEFKPINTVLATSASEISPLFHPYQKRVLNLEEVRMCCTFPKDYDFLDLAPNNVMGRSVLPVMMANISHQIYLQWLSKI